ncbi:MAG: DUF6133 family protein [Clostridia bacterium]
MKNIMNRVNTLSVKASLKCMEMKRKMRDIFADKSGTGYIDQAVVILIAVVLGALLLAGLYALFGDVVMPRLKKAIEDMFNYAG